MSGRKSKKNQKLGSSRRGPKGLNRNIEKDDDEDGFQQIAESEDGRDTTSYYHATQFDHPPSSSIEQQTSALECPPHARGHKNSLMETELPERKRKMGSTRKSTGSFKDERKLDHVRTTEELDEEYVTQPTTSTTEEQHASLTEEEQSSFPSDLSLQTKSSGFGKESGTTLMFAVSENKEKYTIHHQEITSHSHEVVSDVPIDEAMGPSVHSIAVKVAERDLLREDSVMLNEPKTLSHQETQIASTSGQKRRMGSTRRPLGGKNGENVGVQEHSRNMTENESKAEVMGEAKFKMSEEMAQTWDDVARDDPSSHTESPLLLSQSLLSDRAELKEPGVSAETETMNQSVAFPLVDSEKPLPETFSHHGTPLLNEALDFKFGSHTEDLDVLNKVLKEAGSHLSDNSQHVSDTRKDTNPSYDIRDVNIEAKKVVLKQKEEPQLEELALHDQESSLSQHDIATLDNNYDCSMVQHIVVGSTSFDMPVSNISHAEPTTTNLPHEMRDAVEERQEIHIEMKQENNVCNVASVTCDTLTVSITEEDEDPHILAMRENENMSNERGSETEYAFEMTDQGDVSDHNVTQIIMDVRDNEKGGETSTETIWISHQKPCDVSTENKELYKGQEHYSSNISLTHSPTQDDAEKMLENEEVRKDKKETENTAVNDVTSKSEEIFSFEVSATDRGSHAHQQLFMQSPDQEGYDLHENVKEKSEKEEILFNVESENAAFDRGNERSEGTDGVKEMDAAPVLTLDVGDADLHLEIEAQNKTFDSTNSEADGTEENINGASVIGNTVEHNMTTESDFLQSSPHAHKEALNVFENAKKEVSGETILKQSDINIVPEVFHGEEAHAKSSPIVHKRKMGSTRRPLKGKKGQRKEIEHHAENETLDSDDMINVEKETFRLESEPSPDESTLHSLKDGAKEQEMEICEKNDVGPVEGSVSALLQSSCSSDLLSEEFTAISICHITESQTLTNINLESQENTGDAESVAQEEEKDLQLETDSQNKKFDLTTSEAEETEKNIQDVSVTIIREVEVIGDTVTVESNMTTESDFLQTSPDAHMEALKVSKNAEKEVSGETNTIPEQSDISIIPAGSHREETHSKSSPVIHKRKMGSTRRPLKGNTGRRKDDEKEIFNLEDEPSPDESRCTAVSICDISESQTITKIHARSQENTGDVERAPAEGDTESHSENKTFDSACEGEATEENICKASVLVREVEFIGDAIIVESNMTTESDLIQNNTSSEAKLEALKVSDNPVHDVLGETDEIPKQRDTTIIPEDTQKEEAHSKFTVTHKRKMGSTRRPLRGNKGQRKEIEHHGANETHDSDSIINAEKNTISLENEPSPDESTLQSTKDGAKKQEMEICEKNDVGLVEGSESALLQSSCSSDLVSEESTAISTCHITESQTLTNINVESQENTGDAEGLAAKEDKDLQLEIDTQETLKVSKNSDSEDLSDALRNSQSEIQPENKMIELTSEAERTEDTICEASVSVREDEFTLDTVIADSNMTIQSDLLQSDTLNEANLETLKVSKNTESVSAVTDSVLLVQDDVTERSRQTDTFPEQSDIDVIPEYSHGEETHSKSSPIVHKRKMGSTLRPLRGNKGQRKEIEHHDENETHDSDGIINAEKQTISLENEPSPDESTLQSTKDGVKKQEMEICEKNDVGPVEGSESALLQSSCSSDLVSEEFTAISTCHITESQTLTKIDEVSQENTGDAERVAAEEDKDLRLEIDTQNKTFDSTNREAEETEKNILDTSVLVREVEVIGDTDTVESNMTTESDFLQTSPDAHMEALNVSKNAEKEVSGETNTIPEQSDISIIPADSHREETHSKSSPVIHERKMGSTRRPLKGNTGRKKGHDEKEIFNLEDEPSPDESRYTAVSICDISESQTISKIHAGSHENTGDVDIAPAERDTESHSENKTFDSTAFEGEATEENICKASVLVREVDVIGDTVGSNMSAESDFHQNSDANMELLKVSENSDSDVSSDPIRNSQSEIQPENKMIELTSEAERTEDTICEASVSVREDEFTLDTVIADSNMTIQSDLLQSDTLNEANLETLKVSKNTESVSAVTDSVLLVQDDVTERSRQTDTFPEQSDIDIIPEYSHGEETHSKSSPIVHKRKMGSTRRPLRGNKGQRKEIEHHDENETHDSDGIINAEKQTISLENEPSPDESTLQSTKDGVKKQEMEICEKNDVGPVEGSESALLQSSCSSDLVSEEFTAISTCHITESQTLTKIDEVSQENTGDAERVAAEEDKDLRLEIDTQNKTFDSTNREAEETEKNILDTSVLVREVEVIGDTDTVESNMTTESDFLQTSPDAHMEALNVSKNAEKEVSGETNTIPEQSDISIIPADSHREETHSKSSPVIHKRKMGSTRKPLKGNTGRRKYDEKEIFSLEDEPSPDESRYTAVSICDISESQTITKMYAGSHENTGDVDIAPAEGDTESHSQNKSFDSTAFEGEVEVREVEVIGDTVGSNMSAESDFHQNSDANMETLKVSENSDSDVSSDPIRNSQSEIQPENKMIELTSEAERTEDTICEASVSVREDEFTLDTVIADSNMTIQSDLLQSDTLNEANLEALKVSKNTESVSAVTDSVLLVQDDVTERSRQTDTFPEQSDIDVIPEYSHGEETHSKSSPIVHKRKMGSTRRPLRGNKGQRKDIEHHDENETHDSDGIINAEKNTISLENEPSPDESTLQSTKDGVKEQEMEICEKNDVGPVEGSESALLQSSCSSDLVSEEFTAISTCHITESQTLTNINVESQEETGDAERVAAEEDKYFRLEIDSQNKTFDSTTREAEETEKNIHDTSVLVREVEVIGDTDKVESNMTIESDFLQTSPDAHIEALNVSKNAEKEVSGETNTIPEQSDISIIPADSHREETHSKSSPVIHKRKLGSTRRPLKGNTGRRKGHDEKKIFSLEDEPSPDESRYTAVSICDISESQTITKIHAGSHENTGDVERAPAEGDTESHSENKTFDSPAFEGEATEENICKASVLVREVDVIGDTVGSNMSAESDFHQNSDANMELLKVSENSDSDVSSDPIRNSQSEIQPENKMIELTSEAERTEDTICEASVSVREDEFTLDTVIADSNMTIQSDLLQSDTLNEANLEALKVSKNTESVSAVTDSVLLVQDDVTERSRQTDTFPEQSDIDVIPEYSHGEETHSKSSPIVHKRKMGSTRRPLRGNNGQRKEIEHHDENETFDSDSVINAEKETFILENEPSPDESTLQSTKDGVKKQEMEICEKNDVGPVEGSESALLQSSCSSDLVSEEFTAISTCHITESQTLTKINEVSQENTGDAERVAAEEDKNFRLEIDTQNKTFDLATSEAEETEKNIQDISVTLIREVEVIGDTVTMESNMTTESDFLQTSPDADLEALKVSKNTESVSAVTDSVLLVQDDVTERSRQTDTFPEQSDIDVIPEYSHGEETHSKSSPIVHKRKMGSTRKPLRGNKGQRKEIEHHDENETHDSDGIINAEKKTISLENEPSPDESTLQSTKDGVKKQEMEICEKNDVGPVERSESALLQSSCSSDLVSEEFTAISICHITESQTLTKIDEVSQENTGDAERVAAEEDKDFRLEIDSQNKTFDSTTREAEETEKNIQDISVTLIREVEVIGDTVTVESNMTTESDFLQTSPDAHMEALKVSKNAEKDVSGETNTIPEQSDISIIPADSHREETHSKSSPVIHKRKMGSTRRPLKGNTGRRKEIEHHDENKTHDSDVIINAEKNTISLENEPSPDESTLQSLKDGAKEQEMEICEKNDVGPVERSESALLQSSCSSDLVSEEFTATSTCHITESQTLTNINVESQENTGDAERVAAEEDKDFRLEIDSQNKTFDSTTREAEETEKNIHDTSVLVREVEVIGDTVTVESNMTTESDFLQTSPDAHMEALNVSKNAEKEVSGETNTIPEQSDISIIPADSHREETHSKSSPVIHERKMGSTRRPLKGNTGRKKGHDEKEIFNLEDEPSPDESRYTAVSICDISESQTISKIHAGSHENTGDVDIAPAERDTESHSENKTFDSTAFEGEATEENICKASVLVREVDVIGDTVGSNMSAESDFHQNSDANMELLKVSENSDSDVSSDPIRNSQSEIQPENKMIELTSEAERTEDTICEASVSVREDEFTLDTVIADSNMTIQSDLLQSDTLNEANLETLKVSKNTESVSAVTDSVLLVQDDVTERSRQTDTFPEQSDIDVIPEYSHGEETHSKSSPIVHKRKMGSTRRPLRGNKGQRKEIEHHDENETHDSDGIINAEKKTISLENEPSPDESTLQSTKDGSKEQEMEICEKNDVGPVEGSESALLQSSCSSDLVSEEFTAISTCHITESQTLTKIDEVSQENTGDAERVAAEEDKDLRLEIDTQNKTFDSTNREAEETEKNILDTSVLVREVEVIGDTDTVESNMTTESDFLQTSPYAHMEALKVSKNAEKEVSGETNTIPEQSDISIIPADSHREETHSKSSPVIHKRKMGSTRKPLKGNKGRRKDDEKEIFNLEDEPSPDESRYTAVSICDISESQTITKMYAGSHENTGDVDIAPAEGDTESHSENKSFDSTAFEGEVEVREVEVIGDTVGSNMSAESDFHQNSDANMETLKVSENSDSDVSSDPIRNSQSEIQPENKMIELTSEAERTEDTICEASVSVREDEFTLDTVIADSNMTIQSDLLQSDTLNEANLETLKVSKNTESVSAVTDSVLLVQDDVTERSRQTDTFPEQSDIDVIPEYSHGEETHSKSSPIVHKRKMGSTRRPLRGNKGQRKEIEHHDENETHDSDSIINAEKNTISLENEPSPDESTLQSLKDGAKEQEMEICEKNDVGPVEGSESALLQSSCSSDLVSEEFTAISTCHITESQTLTKIDEVSQENTGDAERVAAEEEKDFRLEIDTQNKTFDLATSEAEETEKNIHDTSVLVREVEVIGDTDTVESNMTTESDFLQTSPDAHMEALNVSKNAEKDVSGETNTIPEQSDISIIPADSHREETHSKSSPVIHKRKMGSTRRPLKGNTGRRKDDEKEIFNLEDEPSPDESKYTAVSICDISESQTITKINARSHENTGDVERAPAEGDTESHLENKTFDSTAFEGEATEENICKASVLVREVEFIGDAIIVKSNMTTESDLIQNNTSSEAKLEALKVSDNPVHEVLGETDEIPKQRDTTIIPEDTQKEEAHSKFTVTHKRKMGSTRKPLRGKNGQRKEIEHHDANETLDSDGIINAEKNTISLENEPSPDESTLQSTKDVLKEQEMEICEKNDVGPVEGSESALLQSSCSSDLVSEEFTAISTCHITESQTLTNINVESQEETGDAERVAAEEDKDLKLEIDSQNKTFDLAASEAEETEKNIQDISVTLIREVEVIGDTVTVESNMTTESDFLQTSPDAHMEALKVSKNAEKEVSGETNTIPEQSDISIIPADSHREETHSKSSPVIHKRKMGSTRRPLKGNTGQRKGHDEKEIFNLEDEPSPDESRYTAVSICDISESQTITKIHAGSHENTGDVDIAPAEGDTESHSENKTFDSTAFEGEATKENICKASVLVREVEFIGDAIIVESNMTTESDLIQNNTSSEAKLEALKVSDNPVHEVLGETDEIPKQRDTTIIPEDTQKEEAHSKFTVTHKRKMGSTRRPLRGKNGQRKEIEHHDPNETHDSDGIINAEKETISLENEPSPDESTLQSTKDGVKEQEMEICEKNDVGPVERSESALLQSSCSSDLVSEEFTAISTCHITESQTLTNINVESQENTGDAERVAQEEDKDLQLESDTQNKTFDLATSEAEETEKNIQDVSVTIIREVEVIGDTVTVESNMTTESDFLQTSPDAHIEALNVSENAEKEVSGETNTIPEQSDISIIPADSHREETHSKSSPVIHKRKMGSTRRPLKGNTGRRKGHDEKEIFNLDDEPSPDESKYTAVSICDISESQTITKMYAGSHENTGDVDIAPAERDTESHSENKTIYSPAFEGEATEENICAASALDRKVELIGDAVIVENNMTTESDLIQNYTSTDAKPEALISEITENEISGKTDTISKQSVPNIIPEDLHGDEVHSKLSLNVHKRKMGSTRRPLRGNKEQRKVRVESKENNGDSEGVSEEEDTETHSEIQNRDNVVDHNVTQEIINIRDVEDEERKTTKTVDMSVQELCDDLEQRSDASQTQTGPSQDDTGSHLLEFQERTADFVRDSNSLSDVVVSDALLMEETQIHASSNDVPPTKVVEMNPVSKKSMQKRKMGSTRKRGKRMVNDEEVEEKEGETENTTIDDETTNSEEKLTLEEAITGSTVHQQLFSSSADKEGHDIQDIVCKSDVQAENSEQNDPNSTINPELLIESECSSNVAAEMVSDLPLGDVDTYLDPKQSVIPKESHREDQPNLNPVVQKRKMGSTRKTFRGNKGQGRIVEFKKMDGDSEGMTQEQDTEPHLETSARKTEFDEEFEQNFPVEFSHPVASSNMFPEPENGVKEVSQNIHDLFEVSEEKGMDNTGNDSNSLSEAINLNEGTKDNFFLTISHEDAHQIVSEPEQTENTHEVIPTQELRATQDDVVHENNSRKIPATQEKRRKMGSTRRNPRGMLGKNMADNEDVLGVAEDRETKKAADDLEEALSTSQSKEVSSVSTTDLESEMFIGATDFKVENDHLHSSRPTMPETPENTLQICDNQLVNADVTKHPQSETVTTEKRRKMGSTRKNLREGKIQGKRDGYEDIETEDTNLQMSQDSEMSLVRENVGQQTTHDYSNQSEDSLLSEIERALNKTSESSSSCDWELIIKEPNPDDLANAPDLNIPENSEIKSLQPMPSAHSEPNSPGGRRRKMGSTRKNPRQQLKAEREDEDKEDREIDENSKANKQENKDLERVEVSVVHNISENRLNKEYLDVSSAHTSSNQLEESTNPVSQEKTSPSTKRKFGSRRANKGKQGLGGLADSDFGNELEDGDHKPDSSEVKDKLHSDDLAVCEPCLTLQPENQPASEQRNMEAKNEEAAPKGTVAGLVSLDQIIKHDTTGAKQTVNLKNRISDTEVVQFNVVMVGNSCVGKTSFIRRFHEGQFTEDYGSTIGVDTCIQTVALPDRIVKLQIWDTAGQERFHSITTQVFHKADGLLLMYEITCSKSFISVRDWISQARERAPDDVIMMLLGNKNDSVKREVQIQEGADLAREYNIHFMECSAATGANVSESMRSLAELLVQRKSRKEKHTTLRREPAQKKSGCC